MEDYWRLPEEKQQKSFQDFLCVLIVIVRTHLFSGNVEGDLLGDFLLEDVEDF